jgi:hypothetical protein
VQDVAGGQSSAYRRRRHGYRPATRVDGESEVWWPDPARLASVEGQLGFALNPELVEWGQLHDGVVMGGLLPIYELYGVEGMLRTLEMERG